MRETGNIRGIPPSPLDENDLGATGSASPAFVVTQAFLDEYFALEQAVGRFKHLQEQLRLALDRGASIEDGPRHATLLVTDYRALSVEHLVRTLELAEDYVESLRASAPLQRQRYVAVW